MDRRVNIINASYHITKTKSDYDKFNQYTETAKWLDFISADNIVTIVNAAGNSGSIGVRGGGMAYNSIVVGAVEFKPEDGFGGDTILRSDSSYSGAITGLASRPDICAFGYCRQTQFELFGQTSMATTQVSGALALLCEYNSTLLLYPELQKAVLTAGVNRDYATHITSPYSNTNEYYKYGAGVLDCARSFQIVKDRTFSYGQINKNTSGLYGQATLSDSQAKNLRVSLAYSKSVLLAGTNFILASLPDFEIVVTRGLGSLATTAAAGNHGMSVKITSFTTPINSSYSINLNVETTSDANTFYGIAWCVD